MLKALVRRRNTAIDALEGDANPLTEPLDCERDAAVLALLDVAMTAQQRDERRAQAAMRLESFARMAVCRARFVRHRALLRSQVALIRSRVERRCAIQIQKVIRGMIQKSKYRIALLQEIARLAAELGKKGNKRRHSSFLNGVGTESNRLSPEQALQRNLQFVNGFVLFRSRRYDEALKELEAFLKARTGDGVTARLIQTIKNLRAATVGGKPTAGSRAAQSAKGSIAAKGPAKKK